MCGYTGIYFQDFNRKINKDLLKKMTDAIIHRGPDEEGYYINNNCGLGFRRLSIIDIENGHQPITDESGNYTIVFNGEIYNYKELKNELTLKGFAFSTNTDTEVILQAYKAYGKKCVDKLRGMFSFCIYNKSSNELFLARDRFGIKPLYYYLSDSEFVFGSELKAILISKLIPKTLNESGIYNYFAYGYSIAPYTIFDNVRKLEPGNTLTVKNNGLKLESKIEQYYQFEFIENKEFSFEEYKNQVDKALTETVSKHLVSDVEVGAFLSGGIDSNLVVSRMAALSNRKIKTFTIGFKNSNFNEAELAKLASKKYGTEHHELYLDPLPVNQILEIIDQFDEPFSDSSSIPTYMVSKLASQHVKVVLSGDGGDEFYGGYNSYNRFSKLYRYKQLLKITSPILKLLSQNMPSGMRGKRFLSNISNNPELLQANQMQFSINEQSALYQQHYSKLQKHSIKYNSKIAKLNNIKTSNILNKMMLLDISTYLPDDILKKVDIASMANSLETRVPLIDHVFVNHASQIPNDMKINNGVGKYILRELAKDYVPYEIYNKPKTGFSIPELEWFNGNLKDCLNEILSNNELSGIIESKYIKKIINAKNDSGLLTRVWPILVFERYYKKYVN